MIASGIYICPVGTKHEPEKLKFECHFSGPANTGQRKIEQQCEREIGTLTGTSRMETTPEAREQDAIDGIEEGAYNRREARRDGIEKRASQQLADTGFHETVANKTVAKKDIDSDNDEEEKDAPTRQRQSRGARGELCVLVVLVVLVEVC